MTSLNVGHCASRYMILYLAAEDSESNGAVGFSATLAEGESQQGVS